LEALEDRTVPSTFTVLNLNNAGPDSLRAAITAANANPDADIIKFKGGLQGTITLASELSITEDVTINGPGGNKITVSGGGTTRVFSISGAGTDVTISKLTVADGRATGATVVGDFGPVTLGGGILNMAANLTVTHATLTNNQVRALGAGADATGGAIANVFGASLAVKHTAFVGNFARGDDLSGSGAILNDVQSNAVIEHSTFTGNQATDGPGGNFGGAIGNYDGSEMTVRHSTFENNLARGANGVPAGLSTGFGGAIEMQDFGYFSTSPATLTITNSSFTGNRAIGGDGPSGGIGAQAYGGALDNIDSVLTVLRSYFADNEARGGSGGNGGAGVNGGGGAPAVGGAIGIDQFGDTTPRTSVAHSQFVGNRAVGGNGGAGGSGANGGLGGNAHGGAIINFVGTLDVSHSAIQENEALAGAGGNRGSGTGTVGGNGGFARGGGLSSQVGSTATVSHTAILGNQATGGAGGLGGNGGNAFGGGIFNGRALGATPASFTLSNSLVSANQVTGGAGGAGGNGGNGQGGGIFNGNSVAGPTPVFTMTYTAVTANEAEGGAAGAGGSAGQGVGGGIYNAGDFFTDPFSVISGNDASTSDDDVFGTLFPL
jgi:hypothetical protein